MTKQEALLALFLLCIVNLFSQSKLELDSKAITNILQQYANNDSPGMAVGIVKDGDVVYEHYLGYANLEHQVNIDEQTRFNIASNAKQYTALCILKLIEEEKIKLEDDFRMYLPDLYENIDDRITISNLIAHTSGVRDYCDLMALKGKTWWKQFIDNSDVMELMEGQRDLNFKPGSAFLYSNSNYILLAEIVKKVTGQDFDEFAKTMFEALDMPNTNFLTSSGAIISHRARPYGNWNGWQEEPTITDVHGDGALFTTLQDQLKWEQIVQDNDGKYFSKRFVNKSQSPIANSYGYGLEFNNHKGLAYTFHDGVTGAYNATFLRFPTKSISIVVMSNNRSVNAKRLAWQIADLILDMKNGNTQYPAGPDDIESLNNFKEVLGNYKNEDGTIIRITEKEGLLYRELYQAEPVKLLQNEGGLFEYETIKGLKMNFTNIGKPKQQFTLYRSSQKPSTYYKLPNSKLDAYDKDELNGRFYNEETDTEIILKYIERNTFSLTKNGRERQAELILEDYLKMMGIYEIKVIRNKENRVIGLNIDRGRIKNVIFEKT